MNKIRNNEKLLNNFDNSEINMKGGRSSESDIAKLSPLARKIYKLIMEKQGINNELEKERKLEEKRRREERRRERSNIKNSSEQGQIIKTTPKL